MQSADDLLNRLTTLDRRVNHEGQLRRALETRLGVDRGLNLRATFVEGFACFGREGVQEDRGVTKIGRRLDTGDRQEPQPVIGVAQTHNGVRDDFAQNLIHPRAAGIGRLAPSAVVGHRR